MVKPEIVKPILTSGDVAALTARHPCYSTNACRQFVRLHLPVAPDCNIGCNYCNRRYDCMNESRPGVASAVLTPEMSLARFRRARELFPNLSVVGIAGPGDALANWEAVRRSMELIRATEPEIIFCLATNGLLLPDCGRELVEFGLRHVTVTVNCLEPEIGARIYRYIEYHGRRYRGSEAAELLIANQQAGIEFLAARGVAVKVNIVLIPGINADRVVDVVKRVKALGAQLTNIMPLIPVAGSAFAHFPKTGMEEVDALRALCQMELAQMRHCQHCRADAVGLLTEDWSGELDGLKATLCNIYVS